MDDLKVYHHVSELMKIFDVREKVTDGVSAASFAELLLKNRTPNISVPVSGIQVVKTLSESSEAPEAVMKKYDVLQMKQRRELDPCVSLLAQIASDKKSGVRQFLKRHAEHKLRQQRKLTAEADPEVIKREVKKSEKSSSYRAKVQRSEDETTPSMPRWIKENPLLSWDFQNRDGVQVGAIGELPLSLQERKLIDDLLYCLGGIAGEYVVPRRVSEDDDKIEFVVDESADPSLRELTKRILPICGFFSTVTRFVEERSNYKYGSVNHALSAALRNLMKDYYILLAQLEHQFGQGDLSLQKLWFYMQPTMKNMGMLAFVCDNISQGNCHGGNVLSILHKIVTNHTGDLKVQEVLLYLLQSACAPYFEILEKWIYRGVIFDPHCEFLVKDNETDKQKEVPFNSDEYWEKRYTICRDRIPLFLERVAGMILRTGKYLNVIQQCGNCFRFPGAEKIVYSATERQYIEQTEKAYGFSSRKLLAMLTEGSDLMGRLRSLKHYYLMDQGDFLVQFMDMAEEELLKDIDDIMPTRLEFLLELALRTSVVNYDKYKDDVGVEIRPYDLLSQMFKILRVDGGGGKDLSRDSPITGVEAFVFQYRVQWPLSLIINRHALACYQMLFRHLFYCKYVERLLCSVWSMNKVAKSFSLDASRTYSSAFALRQRMLNFVQNVEYYMMFEVIEPNWHGLLIKMQEVKNVDEVLNCHNEFLESCLKDCMLTIPDLLRTLVKLLKLCVAFAEFMKTTYKDSVEAELDLAGNGGGATCEVPSAPAELMNTSLSYQQNISGYHADFNALLFELLHLVTRHEKDHYSDKMANIWYRLDYSGYYARQMRGK